MNTQLNKPIDEIIKARRSVRTYSDKPVPDEIKEQLRTYMNETDNPFGVNVSFYMAEPQTVPDGKPLGTYGIIRGAKNYIGVSVPDCENNMMAVGYSFEKIILLATSLGLGTCWLGASFKQSEYKSAMGIKEKELFPAVSPFGYGEKKRLFESIQRKTIHADQRKPWKELFYNNSFSTSLYETDTGTYQAVLEMVRAAPSASNKQPWRIVKTESGFHFYEYKTPKYSDRFPYDIQQIDMGIAACHFQLSAKEKGLGGQIQKIENPFKELPEHVHYCFSWLCN